MKPEEAINRIKEHIVIHQYNEPHAIHIAEALQMAIDALRKQIPIKPTVPVDTWLCPLCGEPVEYQKKLGDNVLYHGQYDYCPKCGQAIDWMENKE